MAGTLVTRLTSEHSQLCNLQNSSDGKESCELLGLKSLNCTRVFSESKNSRWALTVFTVPSVKPQIIKSVWSNTMRPPYVTYMVWAANAAAAKTALSTIETHDSSSVADALLLSLTLGDEVWEVLRDWGSVMMIELHTEQTPSHRLLWGEHHPLVEQRGKRQQYQTFLGLIITWLDGWIHRTPGPPVVWHIL